jgi:hypothetical protein
VAWLAAAKRLARYGLTLHPDKTRFVDFRNNLPDGTDHPETGGTSFTFLGFTHIWGKSVAGKNVVRQVTAKNRYSRALAAPRGNRSLTRLRTIDEAAELLNASPAVLIMAEPLSADSLAVDRWQSLRYPSP